MKPTQTCGDPFRVKFQGCAYRATEKANLKSHWKAKHDSKRSKDFHCTLCPSRCYTAENLKVHLRNHLREEIHKCNQCSFQTFNKGSLSHHVKFLHKELAKSFICSFTGCDFRTKYSAALRRHSRRHDISRGVQHRIQCKVIDCTYSTSHSQSFKKHMERRHDPNRQKEFSCPLCSKSFYHQQSLEGHIIIVHTIEKGHKCEQCPFETSSVGHLRHHLRKNHGNEELRLLKCKYCDYSSYDKQKIGSHESSQHWDEIRFKCDQSGCTYHTNRSGYLRIHALTHEDDPLKRFPLGCRFPNCDFRRTFKHEIKKHERNHEESLIEFRCKSCPNNFYPDKLSLHFHESMEHGQASYKCPMCEYSSHRKRYLDQHIKYHNMVPENYKLAETSIKTKSSCDVGKLQSSDSANNLECSALKLEGFDMLTLASLLSHKIPVVLLQKIFIEKF